MRKRNQLIRKVKILIQYILVLSFLFMFGCCGGTRHDSPEACQNKGGVWIENLGFGMGTTEDVIEKGWHIRGATSSEVRGACCGGVGGRDRGWGFTYNASDNTAPLREKVLRCVICPSNSYENPQLQEYILYGNGYRKGTICYYGAMTCYYDLAKNGSSIVLPCEEDFCLRTDHDVCYYNVTCDRGYFDFKGDYCPSTLLSNNVCYYENNCTATGCKYNKTDRPPMVTSVVSTEPMGSLQNPKIKISLKGSDPEGKKVKFFVCSDVKCGNVLCETPEGNSGETLSCEFQFYDFCLNHGFYQKNIFIKVKEAQSDPCGEQKYAIYQNPFICDRENPLLKSFSLIFVGENLEEVKVYS